MNLARDTLSMTDNSKIEDIKEIISPIDLINSLWWIDKNITKFVTQSRDIIRNIVNLNDPRLLTITWPCSIHDTEEALIFAKNAKELQEKNPHLYIVMRTYFEKPRTTVGWKWLINDPNLDDSCDIEEWLAKARKLLMEINEMWVPTAIEFLDTITPQYIADLIHWWAIWARTTESQEHRKLVSGLSMPIWFKNWTDWDIKIAIDAINSSKQWHTFLATTKEWKVAQVTTKGAPNSHIILRWWKNCPNHHAKTIEEISWTLKEKNIDTWIIIDVSHDNSWQNHVNQPRISRDVATQIAEWKKEIVWVMIEANIKQWAQKYNPWKNKPGDILPWVSITDKCVDLETNEKMIIELNDAVAKRTEKTKKIVD